MIKPHNNRRTIYYRPETVPTRSSTPNRHPNQKKRLCTGQPPPKKKTKKEVDGKPRGHSATNNIVDTTAQSRRIHNNNVSDKIDTPNCTTRNRPQINNIHKLTMSTPDPPSGSGTSRRRVQILKRGVHQMQLGSQARSTISQLLHRKGQTQAPPDTDEESLVIGSFHNAPLSARMHSPHVQPAAGRRSELDHDCLYLHHPSHRLDLQSPMALTPISQNHSPELIDNLYLT